MKKIIFSLCICASVFVACSDDDEDNDVDTSGSLKSNVSVFNTDDGDLVQTKVSSRWEDDYWVFEYDENGQCTRVYDLWCSSSYDYWLDLSNPKKVTGTLSDDTYQSMEISYGANGYISKIVDNFSEGEASRDSFNGKSTLKFKYNSYDQVTEITSECNDSYTNPDEEGTWTDTVTVEFEYENQNLITVNVRVDWCEKWKNLKGSYEAKGYYTRIDKLKYSDQDNKFRQFVPDLFDFILDLSGSEYGDISPFFYLGWCGKGSAKIWSSQSSKTESYYYDEDLDQYVDMYGECEDCSYGPWPSEIELNDNGTISSVGHEFKYSYDQVGSTTTKSVEAKSIREAPERERHSRIVSHRHQHHEE